MHVNPSTESFPTSLSQYSKKTIGIKDVEAWKRIQIEEREKDNYEDKYFEHLKMVLIRLGKRRQYRLMRVWDSFEIIFDSIQNSGFDH